MHPHINIPNAVVRAAFPEDLAVVKQLFFELHTYNSTFDPNFALVSRWEDVFYNHVCQPSVCEQIIILAEVEDQVAGLLLLKEHIEAPALHRYNRWVEVQGLYVRPAFRRCGIGDLLLRFARRSAKEQQHQWLQLYVSNSNQVAQKFYSKQGFNCTQQIWRTKV